MTNGAAIDVLLVEDNAGDERLVRERLSEPAFHLECADRLATAVTRLQSGRVDVVLLDLGLPDSEGLATFTQLHAAQPSVPVVVWSGGADEQLAVEAVQAGAQDYLVKGADRSQALARALRYAIERKRAAEEVRKLNAKLEQRVAERTAELEALNLELESFAYAISHDLRAPLRAVGGFAEMLVRDYTSLLPAEGQHRLHVIRDRVAYMDKLIDGLLALSMVGSQSLHKVRISPQTLVHEALDDLRPEREGRNVEISIGELPRCHADPVLLRQVYANLLSNALKYTRKAENACIEVGARQEASGCVYYVRDNGAGFDPRYQDKLFGVFQRLHLSSEFEGIGVGLSLVRRIVQRHGGRVWAESAVGQGATFFFTLGG